MNDSTDSGIRGFRLTGRKVLVILLAFFGTIFVANGAMIYTALSTFSGVETEDAYRKGRSFNSQLTARREQIDLGWRVGLEVQPVEQGSWKLTAALTDAEQAPIDEVSVVVVFWDPTNRNGDRRTVLDPQGRGIYQGLIDLPRPGNWQVRLIVDGDFDTPLEWRRDMILGS